MKLQRLAFLAAAAVAGMLASAGAAAAQQQTSDLFSGFQTSSKDPIQIDADSLDIREDGNQRISVFSGGVVVKRVDRNSEGFALTAQAKNHESEGRIVIYFAAEPGGRVTALKGWNLTDAQGRTTRVRLEALAARSLPASLFTPPRP